MSFGNTAENDIMKLLFNSTALSWAANTNLYVSLHTADPGEGGDQTTSEAAYGSYARVAVSRNGTGGFTVTNNTAVNAADITFPEASSGSATYTYAAVGTASSGTGQILMSGAISSPGSGLAVSTGITPRIPSGSLSLSID